MQALLSLYVRIVDKTLILILIIFSIKLRSVSGTGQVDSVIILYVLERPKFIEAMNPGSKWARERIGQGPIGRFAPGSERAGERKGYESCGIVPRPIKLLNKTLTHCTLWSKL